MTDQPEGPERGVWIPDAVHREDLAAFVDHALRLDEAAVIRLRTRPDGSIAAWVATGLDVLAVRVVSGSIRPDDLTCGADQMATALRNAGPSGYLDTGFPMDAAWRGALPPDAGFAHLDDVPAVIMAELARRGADLARQQGSAHGPPVSLLDQDVLRVGSPDVSVGVPMRCVFALTAMGFVPEPMPEGEIVRVRALPAWLRIDARFGSVYRRRGDPALVVR